MATFDGTSGKDSIFGGNDDDLIRGFGGDDTLFDGLGADTLEGGDGDDHFTIIRVKKVRVGLENELRPDLGDVYRGGEGFDTVNTVTFDEDPPTGYSINLGAGTGSNGDTFESIEAFWGTGEGDTVIGSLFDNELRGQGGGDSMEGGGGDDALDGGDGADILDGGADDDRLAGGDGEDTLRGGTGNDALVGSFFNGIGTDIERDEVHGGAGDDTLTSYSGMDFLSGDGGDDFFRLWSRNTSTHVSGGDGFDELDLAGLRVDEIDWENGRLVLTDASVVTFDGLERIEGVDKPGGPDPDGDCIEGTSGDDVFVAEPDAECFDGLEGDDAIDFRRSGAGVTFDLVKSTAKGGSAEGDTFESIENLFGSNHGDRLFGHGGANLLKGDGGDDLVVGRAGKDTLAGAGGDDTLKGGGGADAAAGGGGADDLDGGGGNDTLAGNAANDILKGGGGADKAKGGGGGDFISGGGGDDTLLGGGAGDLILGDAGNDSLKGDAGDDTLAGGAGRDTIYGGSGTDTASFGDHGLGVFVRATGETLWEQKLSARLTKGVLDQLIGIENVFGSDGDDTIFGSRVDNEIRGEGGRDFLRGGGGRDTLLGGAGQDEFELGFGVKEIVFGGAQADLFTIEDLTRKEEVAFNPSGNNRHEIVIRDFSPDVSSHPSGALIDYVGDSIDVTDFDFGSGREVMENADQKGRDVVIRLDARTELILAATQLSDLIALDEKLPDNLFDLIFDT